MISNPFNKDNTKNNKPYFITLLMNQNSKKFKFLCSILLSSINRITFSKLSNLSTQFNNTNASSSSMSIPSIKFNLTGHSFSLTNKSKTIFKLLISSFN